MHTIAMAYAGTKGGYVFTMGSGAQVRTLCCQRRPSRFPFSYRFSHTNATSSTGAARTGRPENAFHASKGGTRTQGLLKLPYLRVGLFALMSSSV
jgi:hypothetical protein